MKVTQKDIAKKLGVSTSLVSRVLSGRAEEIGIRSEIIKEVENLAKKMNYVPSLAALSLKGKKSATIGVVVTIFTIRFLRRSSASFKKWQTMKISPYFWSGLRTVRFPSRVCARFTSTASTAS